jgi:hypothetical protein
MRQNEDRNLSTVTPMHQTEDSNLYIALQVATTCTTGLESYFATRKP